METGDSPPQLSPVPPFLHPKKASELLKEVGTLVRQSRDPHAAIWVEGLDYPAQYLVRTTRSMTSQGRHGSAKPTLKQEEHPCPQQVAKIPDKKGSPHSAHYETSANAIVTFFPAVNDLVLHKCTNITNFYLPDELFQTLKVRKLQSTNRNHHRMVIHQISRFQSRRKARKNTSKMTTDGLTQQPSLLGTPSHNLPVEKCRSLQGSTQPCRPEVKHSSGGLPAVEVSPPCDIYGSSTTNVYMKQNTLFSSLESGSKSINWLPTQVIAGDGSFEGCKHDRNKAIPPLPRISMSLVQGSSHALNSSEIKNLGHAVWKEDVVVSVVGLAGSPSGVRVSSDQRNMKLMFAMVDKRWNATVYGVSASGPGSTQLLTLTAIGSVALLTGNESPRILVVNLGTECILAACHPTCLSCWCVSPGTETYQIELESPDLHVHQNKRCCQQLEICGQRTSHNGRGLQVVICVARTDACQMTASIRCSKLSQTHTGGRWLPSGTRNLPLPEGYSPISSLSLVESCDSSLAQLLAVVGTELLVWDCCRYSLVMQLSLHCSHPECTEPCLKVARSFLEEGRYYAILVHSDSGKPTEVAIRDDRCWGWLVTFSSTKEEQQDINTLSLHPPRLVFSYVIPCSLEISGQTSPKTCKSIATHCRGSCHLLGSRDGGQTLHLWHLQHRLPWASLRTSSENYQPLHLACCSIWDNGEASHRQQTLLFLFTKQSLSLFEISASITPHQ